MSRTVSIDEMADAINEGLKEYATLASMQVKSAVRKSAKTVKDQISTNAPSRTGAYKGSWVATKQSESSQSLQMVVHSKNRYQLAHLLEKGHAKRGGGRVAGRPHIAPAEQAGIEQLQSLIEKALSEEEPMTHEEVKALVEEMGLPYAYDHFAEGESPDPPFI